MKNCFLSKLTWPCFSVFNPPVCCNAVTYVLVILLQLLKMRVPRSQSSFVAHAEPWDWPGSTFTWPKQPTPQSPASWKPSGLLTFTLACFQPPLFFDSVSENLNSPMTASCPSAWCSAVHWTRSSSFWGLQVPYSSIILLDPSVVCTWAHSFPSFSTQFSGQLRAFSRTSLAFGLFPCVPLRTLIGKTEAFWHELCSSPPAAPQRWWKLHLLLSHLPLLSSTPGPPPVFKAPFASASSRVLSINEASFPLYG